MRHGRHVLIPEGWHDLRRLWAAARPLDALLRPAWLSQDDEAGYRLAATVSLTGLSAGERATADDEFEELELARLVVDVDPSNADIRRVFVPAPRAETVWSIGIATGAPPWMDRGERDIRMAISASDVLDTPATGVADPFLIRSDAGWHMFFEVENWRTWKGEIGHATSDDGLAWQYDGIVLAESFHLSYPHVFAADGGMFMTPESSQALAVRLYRARRFPEGWEHIGDLVTGLPFADPTVFRHGGRWWLFTETSGGGDDTLRLYQAEALAGPWKEHPQSPIVSGDPTRARPAGRVVAIDGRVVRFAQRCRPAYGTDVTAMEIVTLDADHYEERPYRDGPILGPAGAGWNADGMHHIDPVELRDGRWLCAVDGWRTEPPVAS